MADDRPPVDDELIARIAGGDREAFALLYRRYRTDVYRFAAHVSGSPAVADDVVQDVFVAVIEGASGYRANRSGVLPWLLGIARNHVRRWRCQRPVQPLPGDETQAARDLEVPVRYREIIVLCDLQELSYADAAEALGCAVGTVRSRLHRGRALLARRLCDPENGLICRLPATRSLI